jgi:hypothetical protein
MARSGDGVIRRSYILPSGIGFEKGYQILSVLADALNQMRPNVARVSETQCLVLQANKAFVESMEPVLKKAGFKKPMSH